MAVMVIVYNIVAIGFSLIQSWSNDKNTLCSLVQLTNGHTFYVLDIYIWQFAEGS